MVLLFVFATGYALLAAYGYQIDLLHQNIVKTSIIDVSIALEDVEIYFDEDLVAEKAPFQIKNVKPGLHEVKILKDGFTSWNKQVVVAEDVVTQLNDILLLPLDLELYKEILEIEFNYDEVLVNKNYTLLVSRENNKLYFKNNSINVDLEDAQVSFIDNHRIEVRYKSSLNVVDLRNSESITVMIPDEFESFKIAYTPYLTGYYINDKRVYSVDISDEGTFNEIKMFEMEEDCTDDELAVISSYDHVFIKCEDNLFKVEGEFLTLIDKGIKELPEVSSDGEKVVYMNQNNEIKIYEIYKKQEILLGRFINPIESIKWHDDFLHLYLMQDSNLLVCDLEFSNCSKLLEVGENDTFINNSEQSQFIFVKDATLEVYDLSEVL